MKYTWTKWKTNPPKHGEPIVGSWNDPPQIYGAYEARGQACKGPGCCFYADYGESLKPPIWWRPQSEPGA